MGAVTWSGMSGVLLVETETSPDPLGTVVLAIGSDIMVRERNRDLQKL